MFIYQNNQLICACKPVPTFNRANSEWTDADIQGYQEATKYVSQFDKMVKQDTAEGLQRVTLIKNNNTQYQEPAIVEDIDFEEVFEYEPMDKKALVNKAYADL